jgi:superoxide dismutase
MAKNIFGAFGDVPPEKKVPTLQAVYDYEKFYMDLVKKYRAEIEFINGLHVAHTQEVKKFYQQDLPAIQEKLSPEPIDEETKNEWLKHLEAHINKSFEMSEHFIETLTTKKVEEFNRAIRDRINGSNF